MVAEAMRAFARVGLVHPWGAIGHSTGLEMNDGFLMDARSQTVLEPGMVVCLEPSHIEDGDARYHLEDMVAIGERGTEPLSSAGHLGLRALGRCGLTDLT